VENAHPGLLPEIKQKKALDDDLKAKINTAIKECKVRFAQENPQERKSK
jgi:hypothetical protein